MMKVIEMNNTEANKFLLKEETYSRFELPVYFDFKKILHEVNDYLSNHNKVPIDKELIQSNKINYTIYTNKDGKYGWRTMEIMHPVLYVKLVNDITTSDNWLM